jgi:DNA-binding NtrC family response regulator
VVDVKSPNGETPSGESFDGDGTVAIVGGREISIGVFDAPAERRYLLVFNGASSWMHQLPPGEGEVVIGRSETADLRIDHPSVSRAHARVVVKGPTITISDAGSQNGTFVNDQRISSEHALRPGDRITIHKASIILHTTAPATHVPAALLEPAAFRQRVDDELDRAVRYERPMSLLCLLWSSAIADRRAVERIVVGELRRLDALAWASKAELHVMLAETTEHQADLIARRLRDVLREHATGLRIGHATSGSDGFDADGLLSTARSAASGANHGDVGVVSREFQAMTIGAQRILIADPSVTRLYALIERLAPVDLPVLITGETGCGKELAATAIHTMSRRAKKPLVSLNCAAIQETLVESELFGHERGAFSGAVATKTGLVEAASGSTLFLDEIGELALGTQAKLLRVLETRKVTRVGDVREREVDVRIVAATNRNLETEVEAGNFRQDLYFRLSGAILHVPPLRQRPRELPLLATAFLDEACSRSQRNPMTISDPAMAALLAHAWPGNVRELKNLMQYLAAAHPDAVLTAEHVHERLNQRSSEITPTTASKPGTPTFRPLAEELRELEIARIQAALDATGGNQTKAAALLSVPMRTFFEKVKHYNLKKKA